MTRREQNELLRHAVLEVLAVRHPSAITTAAVRRRISIELDFEAALEDVEAALEFLRGIKLVGMEQDDLGSTKYWAATSEGVLKYERGD